MQLWAFVEKLLDQASYIRADTSGIDAVVVVQVLQWKLGYEGVHSAQLVVEDGHSMYVVIPGLWQTELNTAISDLHAEFGRPSAVAFEYIAEICSTLA